MKIRRVVALVTVSLLAAIVCAAGNLEVKRYVLFSGTIDSTTQSSPWIRIKNATRVNIRCFSTHAAFGGADSTTVDSIATFLAIFTDSSTYYSGTAGADSVQLSGVSATDSTIKMVAMTGAPVNKALRGPVNGWGLWSQIYATGANITATITPGQIIKPELLRIKITPVRRSTGATVLATVPNRTNGLTGFRMYAEVYYENQ